MTTTPVDQFSIQYDTSEHSCHARSTSAGDSIVTIVRLVTVFGFDVPVAGNPYRLGW
ncbi:MAG: hypothetical protein JNJ77_19060 [Planctomycetia bacterium]|nr:hypothetical protein [Planctomycetia bacterium]